MLKFVATLSILWALAVPGQVWASRGDEASELAHTYEALAVGQRPAVVTYSLDDMVGAILAKINGRPFTAHQFVGYSGATFAELERYKIEFKARARELNRQTLRRQGPGAVTVYILGATLDGFGIAYTLLNEMIASGELKNVLVTGMASNEAISYHLQGLEKGWGDVIYARQDVAFFKQTYVDAQGHRSWELKTAADAESDTPKILKDLSRFANAGPMTFNVFGGGAQAFNETLEMILESRNRPQGIDIELFLGHAPGKVAKDTGYRAADMLAYLLWTNRFLLNDKIRVRGVSARLGRVLPVSKFGIEPGVQALATDFARADEQIAHLRTLEVTPEVQAKLNYFSVLKSLPTLPLKELENFRVRSSQQLALARHALKKPDGRVAGANPVHAWVDVCVGCTKDGEGLLALYQKRALLCTEDLAPAK